MPFKFLQISDLHLGAAPVSARLKLNAEKREIRAEEFNVLLRRIPELIREHQLDAVILPGDTWDHEQLSTHAQLSAFRQFYNVVTNLAVPVIITPGNHDFYSPGSLYHPAKLQAEGFSPWPEHVLIFSQSSWETQWIPGWENRVSITGRAFLDNLEWRPESFQNHISVLNNLPSAQPSEIIQLLAFHGSRTDYRARPEKMTAPFTISELLQKQYDYTAVGHYHHQDLFADGSGAIKGGYAGCAFARGLDEAGEKGALLVTLEKKGVSSRATVEPVRLDSRKIVNAFIELGSLNDSSTEALRARLQQEIATLALPEDLVYVRLSGAIPIGENPDWDKIEMQLAESYFFLALDVNQCLPAFDLEALRLNASSLEGRFVMAMDDALRVTTDIQDRERLEAALALGLQALSAQEIRLR